MGLFISALTSFTSVSVIVTDPLTAWLCDSTLGWRSSFYLHAAFGFVVFTLWAISMLTIHIYIRMLAKRSWLRFKRRKHRPTSIETVSFHIDKSY
ncbi:hypothetical protein OSTOST_14735 [Ostertagia ostertagi]